MEAAARDLHKYKPVLLGLALSSMLEEVTDEQIADYEGILKQSGDDRQAQLLKNYDALFGYVKEQIAEHLIEEPPVFKKGHIDRRSLLYYNKKEASINTIK